MMLEHMTQKATRYLQVEFEYLTSSFTLLNPYLWLVNSYRLSKVVEEVANQIRIHYDGIILGEVINRMKFVFLEEDLGDGLSHCLEV